jgi:hypothetical protein
MNLPRFTAEASLGSASGHYRASATYGRNRYVSSSLHPALSIPWPRPTNPFPFDPWQEIPGTEVLCDPRCQTRCDQQHRELCRKSDPENVALCVEEMRHMCTARCCQF